MARVLGIIGCGKMAYAILKGILGRSSVDFAGIYVNDIDPERASLFSREFKTVVAEQDELVSTCDIIIIAVKPHQVRQVLRSTESSWDAKRLLVSIAAGITTSTIEKEIGFNLPVIRVMPNTPCLIGEGVAAVAGGSHASPADVELVREMFSELGLAVVVEEKYMDAVTAISGSGPAFAFLVAEAMINAGVLVGLDSNLSRNLVLNTLRGSIGMLQQTGEHPAVLRDQVCSPGGTTIAGVKQLEETGIRNAFFQAIEKAFQRSIELGKN